MLCDAETIACMPLPHRRLTVIAVVSCGRPPLMQATRENFLYGCTLLNLHGLYYTTHGSFWEWAPPFIWCGCALDANKESNSTGIRFRPSQPFPIG
jgi:hypothetical protein